MIELKSVFAEIADIERKSDDVAGQILQAMREYETYTAEDFDVLVYAAYDENGWTYKVGKPKPGEISNPVPRAVKTYVTEIRSAFREGLEPWEYDSMYALRKDVKAARRGGSQGAALARKFPEFAGVSLKDEDKFTGALFHDLLVAYEHLTDEEREAMRKSAQRMLRKFKKPVEEKLAA